MAELLAMYRLWDAGQRHLAAGRYVAARGDLQGAEQLAWRVGDWPSLARIYLPLLEARRQIRYQAAEGDIFIAEPGRARTLAKEFLRTCGEAGTLVVPARPSDAATLTTIVHHGAIRAGRRLEVLFLMTHRDVTRLTAPAASAFAAGLPVAWTSDATAAVASSTDPALVISLPEAGVYNGAAGGLGAVARESLLIAWEALALRWQRRHGTRFRSAVEELVWLRRSLEIDPACEPIAMRLIAVAEAAGRAVVARF